MSKLLLKHDKLLQGNFEIGKYNFLFAFQVNCPGCFLYGIPFVNSLYTEYQDKINFLGLSTAFEDFDFNTEKNTLALLSEKSLVGETKKALKERGYDEYPQNIDFPIAMDSRETRKEIDEEMIESICELNPNYKVWPDFDREAMRNNVKNYLLKLPAISYTFTMNQFRGTPTFVLFDQEGSIHHEWFGHAAPEEIKKMIDQWL